MSLLSFQASDGARIAFRDEGAGPAVLCLSGLSRNSTDFDYVMPQLAGFRVVRMDYRGRGGSEWSGPETYTIQRESLDALELLDHLAIAHAAIFGTSRGGIIAMGLCATAGERVSGVLLNDIGPVVGPKGLASIIEYLGLPPETKTWESAIALRAGQNPGFENVPEGRWAEEARRHYVETADGLAINYDPALRDAVLPVFQAPPADLWPLFDAMAGLPLAALRGRNSTLLERSTFEEMKRRRPDMICAEVADRGHVPFLDEPESVRVIREFLSRLK